MSFSSLIFLDERHFLRVYEKQRLCFWFTGLVCIDEAQKIKNCKSQTSKALKKIKSPMRIALSGTPVENNLSELWSVFDFTIPGYMGTLKDFSDNYAKDIEVSLLVFDSHFVVCCFLFIFLCFYDYHDQCVHHLLRHHHNFHLITRQ